MFSTLRPNIFYFTCVITFAIRTRLESGTKREMTILIMLCFVLPYVAYKHEIDQIRCVACSQCTMINFVAFHFQAHNVSTLWFEKTFSLGDKEQISVKEPFSVTNCQFNSQG